MINDYHYVSTHEINMIADKALREFRRVSDERVIWPTVRDSLKPNARRSQIAYIVRLVRSRVNGKG